MVSSENKDPGDTLGHLGRQEPGQTRERPMREYARHCPPVATRTPMPELKFVDTDMFLSRSEEENACFLSLTEEPPLHRLIRSSCLGVHFNTHSVLVTGLNARDTPTLVVKAKR